MIYQVSKDVKFVICDFEGIVLHLKKRTYYHVNKTGNLVLKALTFASEQAGGVSLETLQQIIGAMFVVPEETSSKDLEAFLKELQKEGIIQPAKEEAFLPAKDILKMFSELERDEYDSPIIVKTPDIITPHLREARAIWPKIRSC